MIWEKTATLAAAIVAAACGCTRSVASVSMVRTTSVWVEPSEPADVYLDGTKIGPSPLRVPLFTRRETVEKTTRMPNLLDAALAAAFPPTLVHLVGEENKLVETRRTLTETDEPLSYTLEVRSRNHFDAEIVVRSDASPFAWRPKMQLTPHGRSKLAHLYERYGARPSIAGMHGRNGAALLKAAGDAIAAETYAAAIIADAREAEAFLHGLLEKCGSLSGALLELRPEW